MPRKKSMLAARASTRVLRSTVRKAMSTQVQPEKFDVVHEADKNAFAINFANGDKALLEYSKLPSGALDYKHTFVPKSQRGKGIAGIITNHAFLWAKENNKKVFPSCSYIRDTYLPTAPADQKAIVVDTPTPNKL